MQTLAEALLEIHNHDVTKMVIIDVEGVHGEFLGLHVNRTQSDGTIIRLTVTRD